MMQSGVRNEARLKPSIVSRVMEFIPAPVDFVEDGTRFRIISVCSFVILYFFLLQQVFSPDPISSDPPAAASWGSTMPKYLFINGTPPRFPSLVVTKDGIAFPDAAASLVVKALDCGLSVGGLPCSTSDTQPLAGTLNELRYASVCRAVVYGAKATTNSMGIARFEDLSLIGPAGSYLLEMSVDAVSTAESRPLTALVIYTGLSGSLSVLPLSYGTSSSTVTVGLALTPAPSLLLTDSQGLGIAGATVRAYIWDSFESDYFFNDQEFKFGELSEDGSSAVTNAAGIATFNRLVVVGSTGSRLFINFTVTNTIHASLCNSPILPLATRLRGLLVKTGVLSVELQQSSSYQSLVVREGETLPVVTVRVSCRGGCHGKRVYAVLESLKGRPMRQMQFRAPFHRTPKTISGSSSTTDSAGYAVFSSLRFSKAGEVGSFSIVFVCDGVHSSFLSGRVTSAISKIDVVTNSLESPVLRAKDYFFVVRLSDGEGPVEGRAVTVSVLSEPVAGRATIELVDFIVNKGADNEPLSDEEGYVSVSVTFEYVSPVNWLFASMTIAADSDTFVVLPLSFAPIDVDNVPSSGGSCFISVRDKSATDRVWGTRPVVPGVPVSLEFMIVPPSGLPLSPNNSTSLASALRLQMLIIDIFGNDVSQDARVLDLQKDAYLVEGDVVTEFFIGEPLSFKNSTLSFALTSIKTGYYSVSFQMVGKGFVSGSEDNIDPNTGEPVDIDVSDKLRGYGISSCSSKSFNVFVSNQNTPLKPFNLRRVDTRTAQMVFPSWMDPLIISQYALDLGNIDAVSNISTLSLHWIASPRYSTIQSRLESKQYSYVFSGSVSLGRKNYQTTEHAIFAELQISSLLMREIRLGFGVFAGGNLTFSILNSGVYSEPFVVSLPRPITSIAVHRDVSPNVFVSRLFGLEFESVVSVQVTAPNVSGIIVLAELKSTSNCTGAVNYDLEGTLAFSSSFCSADDAGLCVFRDLTLIDAMPGCVYWLEFKSPYYLDDAPLAVSGRFTAIDANTTRSVSNLQSSASALTRGGAMKVDFAVRINIDVEIATPPAPPVFPAPPVSPPPDDEYAPPPDDNPPPDDENAAPLAMVKNAPPAAPPAFLSPPPAMVNLGRSFVFRMLAFVSEQLTPQIVRGGTCFVYMESYGGKGYTFGDCKGEVYFDGSQLQANVKLSALRIPSLQVAQRASMLPSLLPNSDPSPEADDLPVQIVDVPDNVEVKLQPVKTATYVLQLLQNVKTSCKVTIPGGAALPFAQATAFPIFLGKSPRFELPTTSDAILQLIQASSTIFSELQSAGVLNSTTANEILEKTSPESVSIKDLSMLMSSPGALRAIGGGATLDPRTTQVVTNKNGFAAFNLRFTSAQDGHYCIVFLCGQQLSLPTNVFQIKNKIRSISMKDLPKPEDQQGDVSKGPATLTMELIKVELHGETGPVDPYQLPTVLVSTTPLKQTSLQSRVDAMLRLVRLGLGDRGADVLSSAASVTQMHSMKAKKAVKVADGVYRFPEIQITSSTPSSITISVQADGVMSDQFYVGDFLLPVPSLESQIEQQARIAFFFMFASTLALGNTYGLRLAWIPLSMLFAVALFYLISEFKYPEVPSLILYTADCVSFMFLALALYSEIASKPSLQFYNHRQKIFQSHVRCMLRSFRWVALASRTSSAGTGDNLRSTPGVTTARDDEADSALCELCQSNAEFSCHTCRQLFCGPCVLRFHRNAVEHVVVRGTGTHWLQASMPVAQRPTPIKMLVSYYATHSRRMIRGIIHGEDAFLFPQRLLVALSISVIVVGRIFDGVLKLIESFAASIPVIEAQVVSKIMLVLQLREYDHLQRVLMDMGWHSQVPSYDTIQFLHNQARDLMFAVRLCFNLGAAIGFSWFLLSVFMVLVDTRVVLLAARRQQVDLRVNTDAFLGACSYIGNQISCAIVGFGLFSFLVGIAMFPIVWKPLRDWLLGNWILFLSLLWPLVLKIILKVFASKFLTSVQGINYRGGFAIYDLVISGLSLVAGFIAAAARIVMLLVASLVSVGRIERNAFPEWVVINLDGCHATYVAMLRLHHMHNQPVAIVFVEQLLLIGSDVKANKPRCGRGARRIQVALLLTCYPSLRSLRKAYIAHKRESKSASSNELLPVQSLSKERFVSHSSSLKPAYSKDSASTLGAMDPKDSASTLGAVDLSLKTLQPQSPFSSNEHISVPGSLSPIKAGFYPKPFSKNKVAPE